MHTYINVHTRMHIRMYTQMHTHAHSCTHTSGRITGGGARGGLAPLVVLKAPLVQLIFRGSGGPQNGPPRAAKRPP